MKFSRIRYFSKAAIVMVVGLFFVQIFGIKLAESAEVIYFVADHGSDANDGLSPNAPFQTIQHAIYTANGSKSDPATIRIAAGIYNEQVVMDSHESLEGGWDAFFSSRRNFTDSNLDSDITASTIIDGESFRRCMVLNNVEGININGLTIQHGWSDDGSEESDIWDDTGAGVSCIASSVSFYNCSFLDNIAVASGSGLHSIDSWVRVNGCRFNSNLCSTASIGLMDGGGGGALYHSGGTLKVENSDFTYNEAYYNTVGAIFNDSDDGWIKGCRFSHNGGIEGHGGVGVESGAALLNTGPSAFIANCIFEHNHAEHFGAMRNSGSDVTIINCLFYDNTTEEGWPGGGALQNISSNVSIYNSTFIDNLWTESIDLDGGHIGNYSSSLEVFNSIFWFHEDWLKQLYPWVEDTPPAIVNSDSTTIVSHSIIDDYDYNGVDGNIGTDPMFIADDNFRLQAESPCKDAGSTELTLPPDTADIDNDGNKTEPIPIDLDGNSRISGDIVDIGAYEYVYSTGSLQVTLTPADAVSAGARWRVDDGEWLISGAICDDLIEGDHTVEFNAATGWTSPEMRTVTIEKEDKLEISGIYVQQTGSLTVTIEPSSARSDGAQWRVDGGDWHNSGITLSNISAVSHTVEYKNIPDWATPGNQSVTINNNQNTNTTGIYTKDTGSLTVTLSPADAISSGALWRVDSGDWQDSGYTESGLATGSHTVAFYALSGWTQPESQTVIVNKDETATVMAMYAIASTPITTGSLIVTISPPEAAAAGAQWRIDSGPWHQSGETENGITGGSHTIEYKSITGWAAPSNQQVTITTGETETIIAEFTQKTGTLQVALSPSEVVSAGAQWRVDSGVWHDSGEMETNLSVGSHTLEFKEVSGWITPGDQETVIDEDQTTIITGTYEKDNTVGPEGGIESSDSGGGGGGGGCFISNLM